MTRLEEIKNEIRQLADEVYSIVKKKGDPIDIERAKSYWYAQIVMALDKDHSYLGSGGYTLDQTIGCLEEEEFEEEDDLESAH